LSHVGGIAARLIIESLSLEAPFPGVPDAWVGYAGRLDRDDLELQDERRQWINEILNNGGSAFRASVIHLGAEHG
jgi:hypothetical protein